MKYLPTAQNDFVWALIGSPWGVLVIWLVLINVVTFLVFGLDKWKAKRKVKKESVRRVPEKTLFLLAVIGGSVGAWAGMYTFRHKTRHWYFVWGIPAILLAQVALAVWLTVQN